MSSHRMRKRLVLLSLSVSLVAVLVGASAGTGSAHKLRAHTTSAPTMSFGPMTPTFVGPAATGCASGCSLMTGPFVTSSTATSSPTRNAPAAPNSSARTGGLHVLPSPTAAGLAQRNGVAGSHLRAHTATTPTPVIPNVRCQPIGQGCDMISTSANGANGVKGLNAVDSASLPTNVAVGDVEPPDQGLCAGNGDIVETNNIGEIMVFNTALRRLSGAISLDTVMGLTSRAWSSGGDPTCVFDASNGGHWIMSEFVSASPEASGGPFAGCFAAVANTCYEGIAVSQGSSPFGPYWVYFLNANYNPNEPGAPFLLNDFAKTATTRDAFLLFYDEFPLDGNGFGGGFFNGAQEYAIDKNALEHGRRVTLAGGVPNPNFNVAIENMGTLPTPDGTCAGTSPDNASITCWSAVIPAQAADSGQWDNRNGGSGFMVGAMDFDSFFGEPSPGDNRVAVWDWTGLRNLNSSACHSCSDVNFGGQVFTGQEPYYGPQSFFGVGNLAPQKAGPIPLGEECKVVGAPAQPCPEGGINPNNDQMSEVSQSQGQLWSTVPTEVNQVFASGSAPSAEIHDGAAYFVISTDAFDRTGQFTMTDQGYVSAAHEDLEMPALAAEGTGGNNKAIMLFTLNGNGGPTGADHGGFYPSTAYGRLTSSSSGLTGSLINIADAGQSPYDGGTEYAPFPGPTDPPRPRWGDYSWGIYLPGGSDRLYFANEYVQFPNCTSGFTLTIGTCGGTRDGLANWGTSVNYVVP